LFFLFIPLLPQQNQQEEPTASAKVQFNVSKIYRWRFGMHSAPNMGNKPHKQKKKRPKKKQNRPKNKRPNTDRDLKTTKTKRKESPNKANENRSKYVKLQGNKPGTRQNNLVLKNGNG